MRSRRLVGAAEVGGESVLAAGQEASGLGGATGGDGQGAVAEGRTSRVGRDGERSLGVLSTVVVVLALVVVIPVLVVVTLIVAVVLAMVSRVTRVLLVVVVTGLSSSGRGLEIQLAADSHRQQTNERIPQ